MEIEDRTDETETQRLLGMSDAMFEGNENLIYCFQELANSAYNSARANDLERTYQVLECIEMLCRVGIAAK